MAKKTDQPTYHFFLGGMDLEMITIEQLLKGEGIEYIENKHLSWGAKLSDYKDEVEAAKNLGHTIVAIELENDLDKDLELIELDHHNERYNDTSSIQQLLSLLGLESDRKTQLIAANDSGYIDGMRKISASDQEIREIREKDRRAQGISPKQEKAAIEYLQGSVIKDVGKIAFIDAKEHPFSCIRDFTYDEFSQIVIYDKSTFCTYGLDVEMVLSWPGVQLLEKSGKAYYGGGPKGYVGGSGLSELELKEVVAEMQKELLPIYSHHIFLCPFKFKKFKGLDKIRKKQVHGKWTKFSFPFDTMSPRDYSEQAYFYDFVVDAFFDKGAGPLCQFERKDIGGKELEFKVLKRKEPFNLKIEDVLFNIYETGVGILSIHLSNHRYTNLSDIKIINDFGRRIYPQYLSDRYVDDHARSAKESFLPHSIKICGIEASAEDFSSYRKSHDVKKVHSFLPKHLEYIMDGLDASNMQALIDDRMYVLSWIGHANLSKVLSQENDYLSNEDWHNLIFCDKGPNQNHANRSFLQEKNRLHTVGRWKEYGTLFGLSRFSFIALTDGSNFSKQILSHCMTMYFQMVQLCLVQRASILKFSSEAASIVKKLESNNLRDEDRNAIIDLQRNYIRFINRLYFREVTAQEQGIELYSGLQKHMCIDRDVQDLNDEIAEMNEFVKMNSEIREAQSIGVLTKVATIFLIPTLLASLLGVNLINPDQHLYTESGKALFFFLVIFSVVVIGFGIKSLIRSSDYYGKGDIQRGNNVWEVTIVALFSFIAIIVLISFLIFQIF